MINKIALTVFIVGFVLGTLISGLVFEIEKTKIILESIQSFTIILVTLFTAWWTSKTFGFNQKTEEAREINTHLSKLLHQLEYFERTRFNKIIYTDFRTNTVSKEYEEKRKTESYNFEAIAAELREIVDRVITIKPYTRILLVGLSYEKVSLDEKWEGKKLREQIMEAQFRLINESNFDIGIEWIRLKNKLGLK